MASLNRFIFNPWNKFWFETDGSAQIRLFSRILGVIFFFFVLSRTPDLDLLYSKNSILPLSVLDTFPEAHFRFSLLRVFDSMQLVWGFHLLLLTSLACMVFGILPKLSAIL